jgi:hypothetical protein
MFEIVGKRIYHSPGDDGNWFVDTAPTQALLPDLRKFKLCLILLVSAEGLEPSTP